MINISLESRKKLVELSEQKETDSLASQFLDFGPVYTQEAILAQSLLQNSPVELNMQDYKTLMETVRQTTNDQFIRWIYAN